MIYGADRDTLEIIDLTADLNDDGTFDAADMALIADCINGPGNPTPPAGCSMAAFTAADKNQDVDVDLDDYAAWLTALPDN